jgi:hypothetical protein
MITLCLVGCCKTKLAHAAPARELYCSPLFRLSRQWAEENADAWAILSAYYGVVRPEEVISPYDVTIRQRSPRGQTRLSPTEFETWLYAQVQAWRAQYLRPRQSSRLVLLAGKEYWCWLANRKMSLAIPLDGMSIGARIRWLQQELNDS